MLGFVFLSRVPFLSSFFLYLGNTSIPHANLKQRFAGKFVTLLTNRKPKQARASLPIPKLFYPSSGSGDHRSSDDDQTHDVNFEIYMSRY